MRLCHVLPNIVFLLEFVQCLFAKHLELAFDSAANFLWVISSVRLTYTLKRQD